MQDRRNYWDDYEHKFSCVSRVAARSGLPNNGFVTGSLIDFSYKRIAYKKNTLNLIGFAPALVLLLSFHSPAKKLLSCLMMNFTGIWPQFLLCRMPSSQLAGPAERTFLRRKIVCNDITQRKPVKSWSRVGPSREKHECKRIYNCIIAFDRSPSPQILSLR